MAQKPSIPKGMRDFSPIEMSRRDFIFTTIKNVFQHYGYQPIETPAMENLTSLLGKYGDEGDRLLFKVLNSGDYLNKVDDKVIESKNQTELTRQISDKGLRYDLTVPFARYVVQHRNEINFPFKRYQIQPVWRADRPQRGRYREFYQCDVDVIGSDSLLNEVELIQIIDEVFRRLGIKALVKLNNRKILAGIAEVIGESENFIHITVAMDKLDKIGLEKVNEEMLARGIRQEAIEKLQPILTLEGNSNEVIDELKNILKDSATGLQGCDEMMTVMNHLEQLGVQTAVEMDLSLARGLDYYTGAIIEVKAADVPMGSICGGGRYDDLTGVFGLDGVSGVGISFGADRIYDVLMELNGFPETVSSSTTALFVNFGEKEAAYCLPVLERIRKEGIKTELFPDPVKLKKQLSWANNRQIPFIVMVGSEEIKSKTFMLKDMKTGEQMQVSEKELINKLK